MRKVALALVLLLTAACSSPGPGSSADVDLGSGTRHEVCNQRGVAVLVLAADDQRFGDGRGQSQADERLRVDGPGLVRRQLVLLVLGV